VVPVSVGGFHDQEITGVGRVRVRDDGGVGAAQISGKRDPVWGSVRFGKRKLDQEPVTQVSAPRWGMVMVFVITI
jgi:hypothetical protein